MKSFVPTLALVFLLSIVSVKTSVDVDGPDWVDFEVTLTEADARGGRGGGGRGGARRSSGPTRSAKTSKRAPRSDRQRSQQPRQRKSGTQPSRNTNVNVNKNVNVDVDRRRGVGAGGFVAGAVVAGAVIASLPSGCRTIYVNNIGYYDCGGTFYVQTYQGTDVVYSVVDNPN